MYICNLTTINGFLLISCHIRVYGNKTVSNRTLAGIKTIGYNILTTGRGNLVGVQLKDYL